KETGTPAITYAVTGIAPGADNAHVVLTVANMLVSGKEGVTVYYTAAGNGTVTDVAGNAMATDAVGKGIAAWDTTAPTMSSAVRNSDTQITVTLSELADAATITKANDGGFAVKETGTPAITYAVTGIAPGADNAHVVLTVANMRVSGAEGVTVYYTAAGNGTVADVAGNAMATDAVGKGIIAWDTWNTFLGDTGTDNVYAIAVDGSGNVYVSGYSTATWGAPVRAYTSGYDAFAAKLDSSGNLLWNTFLGDNGTDYGQAIAVDGSGNVYVSGYSTATWGAPVRAYTAGTDAFAAKLDSSGALQWNTFLGASGEDYGNGIAVDGSGNVYVAGYSNATWGTSPVRAYASETDAFAAKLDSSGALTWNTFLGTSGYDYGYAIVVDGSGNVYVAGRSSTSWGAPVRAFTVSGFNTDAFAAKLDSSGALTWNTFLGGSGNDYVYGIAVDGSGNVYVAGSSDATWGAPVRAYTLLNDAFATRLNSSGALTWNTFLGGNNTDDGYAIAVDGSGNVYVAGRSSTTWGTPVRAYTAGTDALAAKLDSNGHLAPTMSSAVRNSDTQITVTLSELATHATINKANDGGFTVKETGTPAITYAVTSIASGVDDAHVVLTVANMLVSGKEGVTVYYTAAGNGTVADVDGNATPTDAVGKGIAAWDTTAPTFTIQYYSDSGLSISLGDNPRLKAGTYYLKITANEALSGTPTVSIDAEGTANDVTGAATTLVSGNVYKYTRTISSDAAAVGAVLENLSISGTDVAGNAATNVDPTNEASKAAYTDTTYTFPLNPGWNLISLPLIPTDSSITAVLSGLSVPYATNVLSVWSYNAATTTWTSWAPGVPSPTLTTMVDGKGYWIHMIDALPAGTTLTFQGTVLPPPITPPPSYAVVVGWNLMGFKSNLPNTVTNYLTGNDYRFPIYWYGWNTYYALFTGGSLFQPGLGYWVYFNAAGVVTPS
ncbi:MAG: SBBP repeat-containing protein, partial [Dehalococcoidales bacterium]